MAELTRADVEELLFKAKIATQPPWVQWEGTAIVMAGPLKENRPGLALGGRGRICECAGDGNLNEFDSGPIESSCDNAAYIVAACNSVPALCDSWLRLMEENERLRVAAERLAAVEAERDRLRKLVDFIYRKDAEWRYAIDNHLGIE